MIHIFCIHNRKWTHVSSYQSETKDKPALLLYAIGHAGDLIMRQTPDMFTTLTILPVDDDDFGKLPEHFEKELREVLSRSTMKREPRPWLN
jgi:hypothetical protein